MHDLLTKNKRGTATLCCFLFCLLCGCGMFGKSCEDLNTELQALYDGFMDDTTDLSETQILERCSVVLEQCPEIPIAFELTGLMHWENERMKEALENYKKAVALSPDDEDLMADAMSVAFEARSEYLHIADDGKVKMMPFSKITLLQYAQSPPDVRLKWCEFALAKGIQPGAARQEVTNRQGEAVGTVVVDVQSSIKTAQDLNFALLDQTKKTPEAVLFKASTDQMFRHSNVSYTTELY